MKKTCITLIGALLLAACGGGDEASSDLPRGISDTTITIGSHNDLSGPLAIWGVPMTNGMRMRFAELNDAGGVHGLFPPISLDGVLETKNPEMAGRRICSPAGCRAGIDCRIGAGIWEWPTWAEADQEPFPDATLKPPRFPDISIIPPEVTVMSP